MHVQGSPNHLLKSFLLKLQLCGWLLCCQWAAVPGSPLLEGIIGSKLDSTAVEHDAILGTSQFFTEGKPVVGELLRRAFYSAEAEKCLRIFVRNKSCVLHAGSSTTPGAVNFWSPMLPSAQVCLQLALLLPEQKPIKLCQIPRETWGDF